MEMKKKLMVNSDFYWSSLKEFGERYYSYRATMKLGNSKYRDELLDTNSSWLSFRAYLNSSCKCMECSPLEELLLGFGKHSQ